MNDMHLRTFLFGLREGHTHKVYYNYSRLAHKDCKALWRWGEDETTLRHCKPTFLISYQQKMITGNLSPDICLLLGIYPVTVLWRKGRDDLRPIIGGLLKISKLKHVLFPLRGNKVPGKWHLEFIISGQKACFLAIVSVYYCVTRFFIIEDIACIHVVMTQWRYASNSAIIMQFDTGNCLKGMFYPVSALF